MIEEEIVRILINYGVLGVWTVTLLLDKYRHQKIYKEVIERNTEALIKIKDLMRKI